MPRAPFIAGSLLLLLASAATRAGDAPDPSPRSLAMLKDKGILPMVEKAQGFVYLVAKQDLAHIEKLYGINDQMRNAISSAEVTEVLKEVDTSLPFTIDLAAVNMLDAQTCSMLFIIHSNEGPIAVKVYWQPSKNGLVHRVEIMWDWEEIEKMARRMDKVPPGYTATITKSPE